MKILDPVVHLISQISFRNKLHLTAMVFGLPLLVAVGFMLFALNQRVAALQQERAALAIQTPALAVLAGLNQLAAIRSGLDAGAVQLEPMAQQQRERTQTALEAYVAALRTNELDALAFTDTEGGQAGRATLADAIQNASGDQLAEIAAALAVDIDRLNAVTGLLIDGDAASSRLLDTLTQHLSALVITNGVAARQGTVTLIKQSLRGTRRNELTLARGNFNALAGWSLENLSKVAAEHPSLQTELDQAGGRLNVAFLGVQEMLTTKMLETSDFAMAPEEFLALTGKAFAESLDISAELTQAADSLLGQRLAALNLQRNLVVATMLAVLALALAGFISTYISIMRGLNGLADAVSTMADGDLSTRIKVTSRDELGAVGRQFNEMAESLAQRTEELRELTHEIRSMLQNLPQGVLTIVGDGTIHPEYSAHLEVIYGAGEIAGRNATGFLFAGSSLGSDATSQAEATVSACIGEDGMNFDFNAHLLPKEISRTAADGRTQILDMGWSVICDEQEIVEKLMVCVRDITHLREVEAEAQQQKRELAMIGQIIAISQEKFQEFVSGARAMLAENQQLLSSTITDGVGADLVKLLFRNMHTIKGNARTYGLVHLTNAVHEAEQAYAALGMEPAAAFDAPALLAQLAGVSALVEEYACLNETKLGRKGPGRRASAEKYHMVPRTEIVALLALLDSHRRGDADEANAIIVRTAHTLRMIGTEPISSLLAGVLESLPSLAAELGKEPPRLTVRDHGVRIRTQASDLLRNVFMHLYRNALDHGIEPAPVRVAAGKPAAGEIALTLALTAEWLEMRLRDDGKGLALSYIRRKAIEKELIGDAPVADEAVAQMIFASGFSTASAVTEVSGRGVGMDAVRSFIEREGGSIELRFVDDKVGAEFRAFETVIRLPSQLGVGSGWSPDSESAQAPSKAATRLDGRSAASGSSPVFALEF